MGKNTLNKATLCVDNELDGPIIIQAQSAWCERCDLFKIAEIAPKINTSIRVNSSHATRFLFSTGNSNCSLNYKFLEHNIYQLNWNSNTLVNCKIETKFASWNSDFIPSCFLLTLIIAMFTKSLFARNCYMKVKLANILHINTSPPQHDESQRESECVNDMDPNHYLENAPIDLNLDGKNYQNSESQETVILNGASSETTSSTFYAQVPATHIDQNVNIHDSQSGVNQRLTFIDVFRGFAIILMVFVNYGGGRYWYLNHAPWNGITLADIVFPFFVFIMGFSMILSLCKKLRATSPCNKLALLKHAFIRSLILFVIGFILTNRDGDSMGTFRVMGVLQRLGIVNFLLSVILIAPRLLFQQSYTATSYLNLKISTWIELLLFGLLFSTYFVVWFAKAPGCPRGYNGPGGLHMKSAFKMCTGGITGYIDKIILKPSHMYQHPTCKDLYQTDQPFDPEGIMGTFSATVLAYFGSFAARLMLKCGRNYKLTIVLWCVMGLAMGLASGILCSWSREGGLLPLNKNLWSFSFNAATTSLACFALCFCLATIHLYKVWDGKPFVFVGMNPLAVYVGHEVFANYFPFDLHLTKVYHQLSNSHAFYFAQDVWATALWIIIAYIMYRKRIFLKI